MFNKFRLLYSLIVLIIGSSILTACFKDEDVDYSQYNDLIVSNVKFGTLPRIVYTKTKAGADSTYMSTFTATKNYPFTIDHHRNYIVNVDSLPYGIKADKIVFSAFTVNSGTFGLYNPATDSDTAYAVSDTIDFTAGYRDFRLYGRDGTSRRTYRIEVRIHKEAYDSVTWSQHSLADFNDHYALSTGHGEKYEAAGQHFWLKDGQVLVSTDGEDYSADDIDESQRHLLPTADIAWAAVPSRSYNNISEVFLYGTILVDGTPKSQLWRRNIDADGRLDFFWENLPATDDNKNALPTLRHAGLFPYNNGLLLVGIDAEGLVTLKFSVDNGRTWKDHDCLRLKGATKGLTATTLSSCLDADNNLWLLIDGTKVWRGRAHSVNWKEEQTVF